MLVFTILGLGALFYFWNFSNNNFKKTVSEVGEKINPNPLSVEHMRKQQYPGSDINVEQTLNAGVGYERYVVSYKSKGLKIYALMTVPSGQKPVSGWPVIVFNHGYIPPAEYQTTERYAAYVDAFAGNGYIVFKSDYRGHGESEGSATGGYGSADYTIDVLNAVSSLKKYKDADASRIGMWGHSMGGHITARVMVTTGDVKAGVIWAGVIASYPDLLNNWRRSNFSPPPLPSGARRWRELLTDTYGSPEKNPEFWNSISPTNYLTDISGPVQLHHGTADVSVPVDFSQKFEEQMKASGKTVEYFEYPDDDHNISGNFNVAIQRSVEFFDKYVKGQESVTR